MNLTHRINTTTAAEIEQHLRDCDSAFSPSLSSRMNLHEFAVKIQDRAVRFEMWDDHCLVGLVSSYFNDPEKRTGFINHVSALTPYLGLGIAIRLLGQCLDYGRQNGFAAVALEVFRGNERAIRLYRRIGFTTTEHNGEVMKMRIALTPSPT